MRKPKYRLHRGSGQALVEWQGQRTYLGVYGSPESKEAYRRFCARAVAPPDPEVRLETIVPGECTIAELVIVYLRWAQNYYAVDGERKPQEYRSLQAASRPLVKVAGAELVDLFRPKHLRDVRDEMIAMGWARPYINHQVQRVRRMFRWGVERDLVQPETLERLRALLPLRKGKTVAPETAALQPVAQADIDCVVAELSPVVAAMVQLQRWTGMRSQSLVRLRPCDIDRTGKVWIYRPAEHKTAWRGHELAIAIGPRAQAAIAPLLKGRKPEAYLFSPEESVAWQQEKKRAARVSKVQPSQRSRRKEHPQTRPGKRFSVDSYRRAIWAVCDRLIEQGETIDRWSPHRLRHTRATEVRAVYGLEAAQVILGHRHARVTEIYAERNAGLAREIAAASG